MPPRDHFRAFGRRKVKLRAQVRADDSNWRREGWIVDLGVGGACVELPDPVTRGTQLVILVDAPNLWDPLQLDARVAWSELLDPRGTTRAGVEFVHGVGRGLMPLVELLATDPYA
ncbi:MAG: PilZ domain-containing protein [Polyangiaceae bacterium]|nr:PilZ domain-containing protein [Myxococcales bacterium]MCB9588418.1 PilZ domain-containing protein [Polyangiaceae bacterium]